MRFPQATSLSPLHTAARSPFVDYPRLLPGLRAVRLIPQSTAGRQSAEIVTLDPMSGTSCTAEAILTMPMFRRFASPPEKPQLAFAVWQFASTGRTR